MQKPHARELALATLTSLGLSVMYWFPALRDPASTGFGDWQMIHHNWEAGYVSLAHFGEWPLWDPFHCGGVTLLGNPETQHYAPWFWLSFAFGTVVAVKLMLVAHTVIALTGAYCLARRRYQLHPACSAVSAIGWGLSGCFAWDGAGGHATFLPFAFAPWLSYLIHRKRHFRREVVLVTALLLLTLVEGGTYPLPYFMLWVGFELCMRAVEQRLLRQTVWFAALVTGLLALAGAIRFIPVYLALRRYPRTVANDDSLQLGEVWEMLTARSHAWKVPGHPFVWPEYGSYIGVGLSLLGLLGLALAARHRGRRHLIVSIVLWTSLMLGNVGSFAPFTLLHHLPVYDSLRVPSRFAMFVTFYLALLGGYACDQLRARVNPRLAQIAAWLAPTLVVLDLTSAARPIVEQWNEPPLRQGEFAREFHLVKRNYYQWYASYPRLNLGTPACYIGGMNWPVSQALWLGPQPQLRVSGDARATLSGLRKTPNTYQAEVALTAPARVIFNQNFAPGFVSNIGQLTQDRGRLALDLPVGSHRVTVRYRPNEAGPSAAASSVGLLLMVALYAYRSARPQRSGS